MTGPQLRRLRHAAKLSQSQLAAQLGVTANTVARWERGVVRITEPAARLVHFVLGSGPAKGARR